MPQHALQPNPQPKLMQADFGLSKHKYNTFCSNVHDLRGTLPYMAPEMIMDHTHVTGGRWWLLRGWRGSTCCVRAADESCRPRAPSVPPWPPPPPPALTPVPARCPYPRAEKADVWSLGVVFWEMLTLEVPFADMPPAQLIGGTWLVWGPAKGAGLRPGHRAAGCRALGRPTQLPAASARRSMPRCTASPRGVCLVCALVVQPWAWASCGPLFPSRAPACLQRPASPAHRSCPLCPIAALGLGKLRLTIPEWCEPDWRALIESCWVEDPALRPSCRQALIPLGLFPFLQTNKPTRRWCPERCGGAALARGMWCGLHRSLLEQPRHARLPLSAEAGCTRSAAHVGAHLPLTLTPISARQPTSHPAGSWPRTWSASATWHAELA